MHYHGDRGNERRGYFLSRNVFQLQLANRLAVATTATAERHNRMNFQRQRQWVSLD
jgi:hypothetical protein